MEFLFAWFWFICWRNCSKNGFKFLLMGNSEAEEYGSEWKSRGTRSEGWEKLVIQDRPGNPGGGPWHSQRPTPEFMMRMCGSLYTTTHIPGWIFRMLLSVQCTELCAELPVLNRACGGTWAPKLHKTRITQKSMHFMIQPVLHWRYSGNFVLARAFSLCWKNC